MATHTMHDEGNLALLADLVASGKLSIGLFVNDVTPASADGLAELDEPAWAGYERIALDEETGVTAGIIGGVARWVFLDLLWEITEDLDPAVTVYGWFIAYEPESASTKLLFSSRFATPKVVSEEGDEVKFSLTTYQADLTTV